MILLESVQNQNNKIKEKMGGQVIYYIMVHLTIPNRPLIMSLFLLYSVFSDL